jgi:hypothetical protein
MAGVKLAAKLADGLRLPRRLKKAFMLVATLSSRRTNPSVEGSSPLASLLQEVPSFMERFGEHIELSAQNIAVREVKRTSGELIDIALLLQRRSGGPLCRDRVELLPPLTEYLQRNPDKLPVAVLERADSSQMLITWEASTFAGHSPGASTA